MDANIYQKQAKRTLIDKPDFKITDSQVMTVWNVVGISGEAGEVAELVKKGIFHQHGLDMEKLKDELGDLLWYVAGLCSTLGISMGEVMEANIEKLKNRYPHGYNPEDSKKRVDTKPKRTQ